MIICGCPVLAVRITYTGELGWEFYMRREHMEKVYLAMEEEGEAYTSIPQIKKNKKKFFLHFQGKRHGGLGHFGNIALNTLRMEKGFKMWGAEMNLV